MSRSSSTDGYTFTAAEAEKYFKLSHQLRSQLGDRRINGFDASKYLRVVLPWRVRTGDGIVISFRPSTADLRRILRSPITPRGVRCFIYSWLLNRRHTR